MNLFFLNTCTFVIYVHPTNGKRKKKDEENNILFGRLYSHPFKIHIKESEVSKDSVFVSCIQCDSLYKHICADNSKIFSHPERLPEFQGGSKALMAFLRNNIQYPAECNEMAIQGRVTVKFIIDEFGKIICPYVLKSLYPALDEEALRVVRLMPDWQPASNFGVPIKFCYTLPITFKLDAKDLKK